MEYAFKKLLKFRTIQAFSSKLGQFRTKSEDPENMRNCGRHVCGPDSSSCQTEDYHLQSESRSHHSGVKWIKIIVKCPVVNLFDSL